MTFVERVKEYSILPESLFIPQDLRTEEPPAPFLRATFRNGTSKMMGMMITLSNFKELPVLQKLKSDEESLSIEALLTRKRTVEELLRAVSKKKRRHGGGPISPKKRRKWTEALQAEKESLEEKMRDEQRTNQLKQISQLREQLTERLTSLMSQSHPFSPLTVEIDGDVKVVKGKSLTEAEQAWWKYVRKKSQEGPWQFISRGEDQRFFDIQEYFLARVEDRLAQSLKDKEGAKARLEAISNRLNEMGDSDYAPLLPHIQEATDYAATFSRR